MEILRWRHMNVMSSKITGYSTVCLKVDASPHQRNIKVHITGPKWGELTGDWWKILAQRASDPEKASIW